MGVAIYIEVDLNSQISAAIQTFYVCILDADSGAGDNGDTVIAPDTNPGAKRWLKCS